jgi:hypothetical protein
MEEMSLDPTESGFDPRPSYLPELLIPIYIGHLFFSYSLRGLGFEIETTPS